MTVQGDKSPREGLPMASHPHPQIPKAASPIQAGPETSGPELITAELQGQQNSPTVCCLHFTEVLPSLSCVLEMNYCFLFATVLTFFSLLLSLFSSRVSSFPVIEEFSFITGTLYRSKLPWFKSCVSCVTWDKLLELSVPHPHL